MSGPDAAVADPQRQARHALEVALQLAAAGYLLTAVTIRRRADGKKGATFHGNGRAGTAHRGWRHEDAWTSDPEQLRAWWVDHPDTSFAVRTGAAGGVDVVDLDVSDTHDAVAWWAQQGHPLTAMVVTTPSGGMHLYARADGLPTGAGVFAPGVDTRGDGGLVFAPGGYVVGEAGHYTVQGPLVPVAALHPLPAPLADAIRTAAPAAKQYAADGEVVVKDRAVIVNKCREQLGALAALPPRTGGSLFRDAQMGAAMMLGRLVESGAADHGWALEQLERATVAVWGSISAADTANILSGLADGPRKERWRFRPPEQPAQPAQVGGLTRGTAPVSAAATDTTSVHAHVAPGGGLRVVGEDEDYDHAAAAEALDRDEVNAILRRRRLHRMADASERPPLQVLDAATFLDAPQPEYLVPGLLYRDSTAKVFGPPGGTKSFFLLDLALSLATGAPWHGVRLPRTRVHFVMAEGQAVNVARTLGWLHAREVDRGELDGWFVAIPQGVLLTPEGIEQYRALVEAEQPGLIILDTKNAMMLGEENSASDVAVMVRAMRELRDAAGGACVALVDHTGLGDATRGRGSNAVTAAMDTEVRVERDEGGTATAHVTRDKAAEPGREWSYRLTRVENVPGLRPGATDPAVPVPADKHLSVSIHAQDAWWAVPTEELPEKVQKLSGAAGEAARDILRALLYGAGDNGLTVAEVNAMLRERCPRRHGKDNLSNGRNALLRVDVIEHAETATGGISNSRFRVAQHVLRTLENAPEMSEMP